VADDSDDKTEQPTERKLDNARKEGQIAQSQEIKIWAGLMASLVVLALVVPTMTTHLEQLLLPFIERPHAFEMTREGVGAVLFDVTVSVMLVLALPMAVLLVAAIAAGVVQNGLMFVPKRIMPDLSKISPGKGFSRLFSLNNLIEFLKSLFKVGLVGLIAFLIIRSKMDEFVALSAVDLLAVIDYLRQQVIHLVVIAMLLVTAIAAADFFYQRWSFNQRMKMTKQEVKDEHKQTEGDPMVKGRLRSLRMQRARQRMMAAVPKADVVVTNPTHFAVALKYDMETMNAPVLVAKGADLVAKRIRDLAEENEVPVVENPPLARALYATVELDEEIPPEHYKAVAEVISYVMGLKNHLGP